MPDRKFVVETLLTAKNLTKKAMADVTTSMERMQRQMKKVNITSQKMAQIGTQFKTTGRSMAFAGLAIGGALGFAVKGAVDYEKRFGRISTLLNDDVAGAMEKYGSTVRKIAIQTGAKLSELQDAFFEAKSGGVALAEVTDFITLAQKGAVGGFTDSITVTKALTKVMNAYKLDVNGARKVLDQFFIANDVGQTTIGELGRTVGTVAGSMALFGASTGEMLSAIAIGTKVLPSTEEAVTALNGLLTAIRRPTEDATAEIERLNSTLDASSKIDFSLGGFKKQGLLKFFKQLMKVTGGNVQSLEKLFGANVRGFRILATLVQQEKEFVETTKRMESATEAGTLSQLNFNKQTKTMAFRMAVLKARFEDFRVEIGQKLFPVLEEMLPKIESVLMRSAEWINENKKLTSSFLEIGLKAVPVLIGVGGLSWALGSIVTIASSLVKIMGALKIGFLALSANPVILGITAVIALIAWAIRLYKKWQRLGEDTKPPSFVSDEAKLRSQKMDVLLEKFQKGEITREQLVAGKDELLKGFKPKIVAGKAVEDPLVKQKSEMQKLLEMERKKQSELTKILKDGMRQRENAQKKQAEKLDIFERGRGRILTEEVLSRGVGGMKDAIVNAVTGNKAGGKTVKIENVNLNNVTNAEEFVEELNAITFSTGVVFEGSAK